MMTKRIRTFLLASLIIFAIFGLFFFYLHTQQKKTFSGNNAFDNAVEMMSFGPRTPGGEGHKDTLSWIVRKLQENQWEPSIQSTSIGGISINNVIAKSGEGKPWVILGSHYDSRILADRDPIPEYQLLPVPGANDGASSTALLIELSRVIPQLISFEVWLVFFDAEDNGSIDPYDWIMGSSYFVSQLKEKPDSVVILDMVGDQDLTIYQEKNSDFSLSDEIWATAEELGYQEFVPSLKYRILDDHIPFLEAGITSVDIIDFDYPYWHTTQDTIDKISPESLEIVGRTILAWLQKEQR